MCFSRTRNTSYREYYIHSSISCDYRICRTENNNSWTLLFHVILRYAKCRTENMLLVRPFSCLRLCMSVYKPERQERNHVSKKYTYLSFFLSSLSLLSSFFFPKVTPWSHLRVCESQPGALWGNSRSLVSGDVGVEEVQTTTYEYTSQLKCWCRAK